MLCISLANGLKNVQLQKDQSKGNYRLAKHLKK